VVGDEEGCGQICISLSDLLEGKGGTPEARLNPTTSRDTGVKMG